MAMAPPPPPGPRTDQAAEPAPTEIERKYLLSALPERALGLTPAVLRQGYLPGERLIERIRCITLPDSTRWVRTVKLGAGLVRIEVEEDATPALGEALWALTTGKRVEKVRYAIPEGDLVWEIDAFTDRQLFLAEVELPHADHAVRIPDWLHPHVVREVTDEREFTNWSLAR